MTTTISRTSSIRRAVRVSAAHPVAAALGRTVTWVVLGLFAVFSLVPMVWLVIAPSKSASELNNLPAFQFGGFSGYINAWNHLLTFENGVIMQWVVNSLWYTALVLLISCTTAILSGYALAATDMPFRRTLLIATLIAMIVPPVALVLPLFIEVSNLGLFDSPWAVILTSSFYPFGTFLSYIYFTSSIPAELYEAARLDGCTEFGTFWRVALPLSKGLLGMLAFFSFSSTWANYFLPYLLLATPSNFNLPVGLGLLFSSTPALNPLNGAQSSVIGRPEIALAGLIVAVPILIVFLLSSRLLVRGVLAGSVKS